jgi:hypothetical protein
MAAPHGGRGIEDMLNLPHLDDMMKENGVDFAEDELSAEDNEVINESMNLMDMAAQKLASVEGTDHAQAMDTIYKETLDHSRNLMDLAYNVDERSRRGILEIATSMYKNAIEAKNSKREMQLKVMKIMQDQQKLDLDEKKFRAEQGNDIVETKSMIVEDRNELIKRIRAQAKEEKDNPDK